VYPPSESSFTNVREKTVKRAKLLISTDFANVFETDTAVKRRRV
jgi:hypothetical protein